MAPPTILWFVNGRHVFHIKWLANRFTFFYLFKYTVGGHQESHFAHDMAHTLYSAMNTCPTLRTKQYINKISILERSDAFLSCSTQGKHKA